MQNIININGKKHDISHGKDIEYDGDEDLKEKKEKKERKEKKKKGKKAKKDKTGPTHVKVKAIRSNRRGGQQQQQPQQQQQQQQPQAPQYHPIDPRSAQQNHVSDMRRDMQEMKDFLRLDRSKVDRVLTGIAQHQNQLMIDYERNQNGGREELIEEPESPQRTEHESPLHMTENASYFDDSKDEMSPAHELPKHSAYTGSPGAYVSQIEAETVVKDMIKKIEKSDLKILDLHDQIETLRKNIHKAHSAHVHTDALYKMQQKVDGLNQQIIEVKADKMASVQKKERTQAQIDGALKSGRTRFQQNQAKKIMEAHAEHEFTLKNMKPKAKAPILQKLPATVSERLKSLLAKSPIISDTVTRVAAVSSSRPLASSASSEPLVLSPERPLIEAVIHSPNSPNKVHVPKVRAVSVPVAHTHTTRSVSARAIPVASSAPVAMVIPNTKPPLRKRPGVFGAAVAKKTSE